MNEQAQSGQSVTRRRPWRLELHWRNQVWIEERSFATVEAAQRAIEKTRDQLAAHWTGYRVRNVDTGEIVPGSFRIAPAFRPLPRPLP